jgi:hypothetical protein
MTLDDWAAVHDIYEAGIATGNATFETTPPAWHDWVSRHLADHRLVATNEVETVLGWAALSPVADRYAYAGVAVGQPKALGRGESKPRAEAPGARRANRRRDRLVPRQTTMAPMEPIPIRRICRVSQRVTTLQGQAAGLRSTESCFYAPCMRRVVGERLGGCYVRATTDQDGTRYDRRARLHVREPHSAHHVVTNSVPSTAGFVFMRWHR